MVRIPQTGGARSTGVSARVAACGCALLAAACYANTLRNDFCYDDVPIVRDSKKVNAPGQWLSIWTTDYWSAAGEGWPNKDLLYRPVAVSSYRLVRTIAGPVAWPQHLVNLLLHAVVSAMVVAMTRRLHLGTLAAALAGALFAVLPIHTEAVASIAGRADLLAAFGVLAALLAHGRAMRSEPGSVRLAWTLVAAIAAFVAMGAKESAAAVVPLVVLWDAVTFRRRAERTAARERWCAAGTLFRLGDVLFPTAAYLALRLVALDGRLLHEPVLTKTVNVLVDSPPWQHALGALQLFGMYWAKTIVPWTLSIGYSINSVRPAMTPLHVDVVVGAAAAAGLIATGLWAWRSNTGSVLFVVIALVVSYAPTSNTLSLIQVFFAERLWYMPSIWVVILAGFAGAKVCRGRGRAAHLMIAVLLVGFACRTWSRNNEWRDNGRLFAAAVRDQPNGVQPLCLYGQWLVEHDSLGAGIALLERALVIDVGYTDAHRVIGAALLKAGRPREALSHLQTAEMQAPGHEPTMRALRQASALLAEQSASSLLALRAGAKQAPDDVDVQLSLVRQLRDLGRVTEALDHLAGYDRRFAARAEWQSEYAVTLVLANRLDEAIERYDAAIALDPRDPRRLVELAMLLLERRADGDLDRAWALSEQAVRVAPDLVFVLAGRAELLAIRGDVAEAQRTYRRVIQALPPGSEQRQRYEQRARALGE